jgi:hypothetical protein
VGFGHEPNLCGRSGRMPRIKEQSRGLFAASITGYYEDHEPTAMLYQLVADHAKLWCDTGHSNRAGLWKSTLKLSESLFNEVVHNPVPVDLRSVEIFQWSPLVLDIYTWLTCRVS